MKTRLLSILMFSFFLNSLLIGQSAPLDPDDFLLKGEKQAEVLLVGTFHFAYYGLDAHKTSEEDKIDILSAEKQKEVDELVDYIIKFKPTKLIVEGGHNSGYIMHRYRECKNGNREMIANEIDQICFRLMDKLGLDTLYGADAESIYDNMYNSKDSLVFRPYLDSLYQDWDFRSDDEWSQRYMEWYEYGDKMSTQMSLLDNFKGMNEEKATKRRHGAYLVGDFKLGNHRGADALAMYWYSRNLRIFRNIQQVTTSSDDRILVLFGAGHMSILKQLFESTPEYKLIPFNSLGDF